MLSTQISYFILKFIHLNSQSVYYHGDASDLFDFENLEKNHGVIWASQ